MTQYERVLCKMRYWQAILNLQEWELQLKIVSQADLKKITQGDCWACIVYVMTQHTATVYIDQDLDPAREHFVILHELLHLVTGTMNLMTEITSILLPKSTQIVINQMWDDALETAINRIDKSLLQLYKSLRKQGETNEKKIN